MPANRRREHIVSFIISLYIREGIVMASDSRLTLSSRQQKDDTTIIQMGVGLSDSTYKTFLTMNNIGISFFGAPDVQGVPITGYIESFVSDEVHRHNYEVDEVPQALIDYFGRLEVPPNSGFLVAGYKIDPVEGLAEQHVWEALVKDERTKRLNQDGQWGAAWRGVTDILSRLLMPVTLRNAQGEEQRLPHFPIQWGYFTLQDAIDYAQYAVQVTADTMRFHPRPKVVGGPVDVLVIKPATAFWVKFKDLQA
jgi:hypothetical protein